MIPENETELISVVDFCKKEKIPYFILGNGSNILFTDSFHKGAYISTSGLTEISLKGDTVIAQCGVKLSNLCSFCAKKSLTGIEELSGIPGTVGGAVYMNAGAYGGEIKDRLIKTVYLNKDGKICVMDNTEHNFGYRTSIFQKNGGTILSSSFKLEAGDKTQIKEKTRELLKRRSDKQPLNYKSAGSTFKRPEGYFAGKLIEDSGLKGFSVGDAMVSEKHCGFVVNTDNAAADDIIAVIEHVKKTVYEKFGVLLEEEVKII